MCLGMSYPNPAGEEIAKLKRGDEITIAPGFGYPPSQEVRTEIVLDVDGFSALTNAGTRLMCDDGAGVEQTGRHFDVFDITPEAQSIIDSVESEE